MIKDGGYDWADPLQRVALDDPNRGGVLGMAATLVLTSAPERTSPIRRGVWILDAILGQRPPDPPPNIPPLEEAGPDRRPLTLRDQMELHRNDVSCARCHDAIDPLGLALENFGPLGEWRDRDKSGTIDASATLPGRRADLGPGRVEGDPAHEVPRAVRPQRLPSGCFAYALGRAIQYSDRPTIDRLVAALKANDYRSLDPRQGDRRQRPVRIPRGLTRGDGMTKTPSRGENRPPWPKNTRSPGARCFAAWVPPWRLPWLEIMSPAIASAGTSRKPPLRLGVLFKGNGVHPPSWDITGSSETDFRLSPLLEPLAPVRDKVLILSNLAHREGGGSHHAAAVAFLSGADTPGSIDVPQPVTIDQLAADRLGQHTPLRSLELTADSLFLSQPRCSYISYGVDGKPVRREDDPQIVFDRLFRGLASGERLPRTQEHPRRRAGRRQQPAALGQQRRRPHARRLFRGGPRRRADDRSGLGASRRQTAGSRRCRRT